MQQEKQSFLTGIVASFVSGNLVPALIFMSLVAGFIALLATPREEEPQIVVPMADIIVEYPGGSPEQVEKLVASRLERYLYQIDGVEYVYSVSRPGMAIVTVRFFVGENREDSLIKLHNQLARNIDRVTPGITGWIVRPVEIDDVPIVSVALYGDNYCAYELRRVAEEVASKLQHVRDSARISIHGGRRRVINIYPDPERMSAYRLSFDDIAGAIQASNITLESGAFDRANQRIKVQAGPLLRDAAELEALTVGMTADRPVYLRDIAEIIDGPDEVESYSRFGLGPADPAGADTESQKVVTVAVAKKKGSNAVQVSRRIQEKLAGLEDSIIPGGVNYRITRDYGETANEKVNDLVKSLALAILTVIGLLALTMSWREGIIVAIAVPVAYSLTLLMNMLMGFTINRVTLFALILAMGLLVDDPIAGVENIERHLRAGKEPRTRAVIKAMQEIMAPIILSTLAIIVAFTPMFFISGMMGPYMMPMALNVPVTVTMSTVVALTITPWLAKTLLKPKAGKDCDVTDITQTGIYRAYCAVLTRFVDSRRNTWLLLGGILLAMLLAVTLALTGAVPLKMLPFDNKNEFQILVDMPEGTTLETTDQVVRDIEDYLRGLPEAVDYTSTVGESSPMDFNGMVRHYYMRQGAHMADVRVNLAHSKRRAADSHAIVLRIRDDITAIGEKHGAALKLIEVPPGPPVLSTLIAEIYGQPHHSYEDLIDAATIVKARMAQEPGVVDLDDTVEAPQPKLFFNVDRDKAARNGIAVADVTAVLRTALSGMDAGLLHIPQEHEERPIRIRLPRELRSSQAALAAIPVKGMGGTMVQLGELGEFEHTTRARSIYHKNQERVVYVTAEVAGRGPAYAVLALQSHFAENPLPEGITLDWRGEGEWKITLDVFRDLGIAFSVALLGIYLLLVYETRSYVVPLVIMSAIPLTIIGIMPGFAILNLLVNRPVGGYANPVFFTATAMIGMIALAGIVVRNAVVLIDFIRQSMAGGLPLREAILQSGAVRMRPILLTAGTTLLGTWPITMDPIFSGLAWALIFGLLVSTVLTLVVVPSVYMLIYANRPVPGSGGPAE